MGDQAVGAAHIITNRARALGDPSIIVTTRDVGLGGDPIGEPISVPAKYAGDVVELIIGLRMFGWVPDGGAEPVEVQPGYYVLDVVAREAEE